ncbi:MAG TPA: glycosyltransferase 87 family protein [Thermoanaerobaculia bacterium]|jgi:4-amino-4-deoxy-L-arabinose transferase-like glycosyltransferase
MKRAALTTLAVLAAIYTVITVWRETKRAAGLDFYIYYVNAQLAGRDDVGNIYDADVQSRVGEEYYERGQRSASDLHRYDSARRRFVDSVSSPFLYTTLRWVSRDYERALTQYHVLVFITFIGGFVLIARRARMSWAALLFLLCAMLLWYGGWEGDLRVGNVNSIQLGALGVALVSPPLLAGVVTGMLIAFKPNLLIVPLLLMVSRLATRDWKRLRLELLGSAIGVAIALAVAAISYGSFAIWLQWVARANEFYHRLPTRMERNVTPALSLFHEYGAGASYALAALLTLVAIFAVWRAKRRDDVLIAGIAILIYLLSATVVWLHYMVLVVPVALALMRNRVTAVIALLALAAIAEEPYQLLWRKQVYPNDAYFIGPALVALFLCAIWMAGSRMEDSTRLTMKSDEPKSAAQS